MKAPFQGEAQDVYTPNFKVEGIPMSAIPGLETMLGDSARCQNKGGKAAGQTIDLIDKPFAIYAVLAFVTATGAPAAKCLLAPTTDYTFSGTLLTCVSNQSANSLVILYRV